MFLFSHAQFFPSVLCRHREQKKKKKKSTHHRRGGEFEILPVIALLKAIGMQIL